MKIDLHKEFNYEIGGELKKKIHNTSVFTIIGSVVIFNLIPIGIYTIVWFVHGYSLTIILVVLWYFWLVVCFNKIKDAESNIINTILYFPIFMPSIILYETLYHIYSQKYPNSDDPEYLKKWNRRKKIKTIL